MVRRIGLVLVLFLLAACNPVKPEFVSPLLVPKSIKVYLPTVLNGYQQSKKCVALSDGFEISRMVELGSRCTYSYNPSSQMLPGGIEMLGMVQYPNGLKVVGDAGAILGFNEPDSHITPAQAAEVWPQVIALNPGKAVVSPAPSHLFPEWLSEFYAAHVARWGIAPKLDVLAIHCYSSADECIRIVSQGIARAKAWNIPQVWVTEFAFSADWQSAYPAGSTWRSEAEKFIDWMNAQPLITRYYWWSMSYDPGNRAQWWSYGWPTNLYDWTTKQLNERGRFYQGLP